MAEVKLSYRMQEVVSMIDGGRVADIGCDHAFVSIYLIQNDIASKVIAMDVKDGPLNIAKDNIELYGLSDVIEVRKSNGFDSLSKGEIDAAIIAGMGGHLIIDILSRGHIFTDDGVDLVLQPQSEIPLVRKYLYDIGYDIVSEKMLIDEGKYYVVLKAKKSTSALKQLSDEEIEFGRYLLIHKDSVLEEYLVDRLNKNNKIIEKLSLAGTDNSKDRIRIIISENAFVQEILDKYF